MEHLSIVVLGNDVLKTKAEPVADINEEVVAFSAAMVEAMKEGRGIGLAAPQVGSLRRMFVTLIDGDKPRVFINPEIVATGEELADYEEGCLSVPGVWADVKRPVTISVQAWNERGRPFRVDADGLLARVIQHEYDHLNGILFIDRLSELKRKRLVAQWEKKMRA